MTLISWNVNGIRAVHNKQAFAWLEHTSCDVLCLQEIKASKEQIPHQLFTSPFLDSTINSATKAGYSGVATFSMHKPLSTTYALHIDTLQEGRIIEQDFGEFILFNVYFPNGQKDDERLAHKMKFYEDFLAHIIKLKKSGKSIIVCGDVNTAHREIDLKNPKANSKTSGFLPQERAWIDALLDSGFIDTFRYVHGDKEDAYSWWSYRFNARTKNVGWRIDYFFVSDDLSELVTDAFILDDIAGSDHCPVGISLDI